MLHFAEYIWLDGARPTQRLRSKSRILDLNARFAQLGDLPLAEAIGRRVSDVLPAEIARQISPQLAYVARNGGALQNVELRGHLPHGGSREFAWIANLHALTDESFVARAVAGVPVLP